ncbi:acyl-CoA dehydrogenase [Conexibacter sp. W3-3-2]|nr:acyl-CoA dehydrogenase family protein [Conexibacter sp. W3-3-2]MTD43740.1 acyl-CoA dehydrogenase [Conexibacter sp. W3-3-2]
MSLAPTEHLTAGPNIPLIIPDEERMIREAVAGIAGGFGHDYFAAKVKAGERTDELWDAMGKSGYLGVNLPEEYGGGGLGMTALAAVSEELSRAGCPLMLLVVSPAIVGNVIAKYGTIDQKDRWLGGLASGEKKCAFAITEPDAGSNSHKISTVATKDGSGYRINGTKTYISGVEEAEAMLVVTRTGVDSKGRGRLSLFMVDTDAPGLERQYIDTVLEAPESQWMLFFDNVEVSEDRRIGAEGEGLRIVFDGLNPERIMGAAMCIGLADYAMAKATQYANERSVWGVPIGQHQGVSHPLAQAKIELELARLMTRRACAEYDAGIPAGEASNIAKFAAAEAAIKVLDQAIQTHGGNGMAREYGLADLWFIVRLLRTAPVSREMVLNYVAEHSLGLPKSY